MPRVRFSLHARHADSADFRAHSDDDAAGFDINITAGRFDARE